VDFSEASRGAAHYARALAEGFGAKVKALRVLHTLDHTFAGLEGVGPGFDDFISNRLELARRDLAQFVGAELPSTAEAVVLQGDPAHQIVHFAQDQKANLILLPTHGYGPFRRFILGSVTAKVLHDADCPVWTGVHLAEAPPPETINFRSVLCAVDLGPQSHNVLCWAAQFAGRCEAHLTLLHVVPALDIGSARNIDGDWNVALTNKAWDGLRALQDRVGTRAEQLIESGQTAAAVRVAAEGKQADLIVIGRGATSGAIGRLRANAYAIIRESPCPVVSV
jgi:nucleotide-binding universal stress UspA family protein